VFEPTQSDRTRALDALMDPPPPVTSGIAVRPTLRRDAKLGETAVVDEGEWQSWNKYWGHVLAFYFGTRGYAGWFPDSQKILVRFTDPSANAAVAAQLTSLGRRIGGELAKQDDCRKVRTSDTWMERATEGGKPALLDWQDQLNKAAVADSGSGAIIEAAVKSINSQLDTIGVAPLTE
jgi:hypothetical protein